MLDESIIKFDGMNGVVTVTERSFQIDFKDLCFNISGTGHECRLKGHAKETPAGNRIEL